MKIYVNGSYYSEEEAKISVFDHGFLYGDGVFEGIRIYNNKIFKLDEHIERLYDSAKALNIKISLDQKEIEKEIIKTAKINSIENGYVRIVISRGNGDLGLDPRNCRKITIVIIVAELAIYPKDYYEKGLAIITSSVRRTPANSLNPKIKSLNYLNNIMAKMEATLSGCLEAIMLDLAGYVVECTGDNIFIIKKNKLITPPESIGALKGITRDQIISISKSFGYDVLEEQFTQYDVYTADECFLTGTAAEVIPVVSLDGRIIGNGLPGKITKLLSDEYRTIAMNEGVDII